MNGRLTHVCYALPFACIAAACGSSSPTQPSSSTTASVASPRQLLPSAGAQIRYIDQPVTLTVQNAVVTKSGGTTYMFEVASDAGFATKVQTKDGVAEGGGGQTSVKLDTLAASTDYYWHARAQGGGTTGVFSATMKFTVGAPITINPPTPISPLTGTHTFSRPTLLVTNAVKQGPTSSITYKFEVSTSSTFVSILLSGTNTEGVNQTGFVPTTDLPTSGTLFWRATATDTATGVSSTPSTAQSFTADRQSQAAVVAAKLGVKLWPGIQPPGTNGQAIMGSDWTVETLVSFDGHSFLNPPLEELQMFDLLDRGMDPNAAIAWMFANGYPTTAAYYPDVGVIGYPYEYLAFIGGQWDIVIKVGA